MPGLIPLIKDLTPNRPVLYRSHIQIRSDLVAQEGSPQADIWQFLWEKIKRADMFISHPIPSFVPHNVPKAKVTYLPATTDWYDGLNKDMNDWDVGYYGHMYNSQCHALRRYVPDEPRSSNMTAHTAQDNTSMATKSAFPLPTSHTYHQADKDEQENTSSK